MVRRDNRSLDVSTNAGLQISLQDGSVHERDSQR